MEEPLYSSNIIENAIEIASEAIEFLQDYYSMSFGRNAIIANYIIPWAVEAEQRLCEPDYDSNDTPYYDFITKFVEEKLHTLIYSREPNKQLQKE